MGEAPGGRAIDWINTPDQEFHVLSSPSGMTVSTRDPGRSDTDDRADAKGPPPSPSRPAPSWDPANRAIFLLASRLTMEPDAPHTLPVSLSQAEGCVGGWQTDHVTVYNGCELVIRL
jgi:hypothetical protein